MYKLFEKFVSKFEKGTGLGLFISKGIVEANIEVRYGLKTIRRIERELHLPSHCL
jgi:K+-sensing histidine kinase KdpD